MVGRAPVVGLAIPLLGVSKFAGRIGKRRALFVLFCWNAARSWAWTSLNCWNFSWFVAAEQPWPRFVPPGSSQKASTASDSTGLCTLPVFH